MTLKNTDTYNINKKYLLNLSVWITVAVGILLRLIYYMGNRSLWGDEAAIAVNILEKDFNSLAQPPLLYDQQAPLFFLYSLKLLTVLFDDTSEWVLRFFSFICGITAVVLFYSFAKKVLPIAWVLIAQICFSFCLFLIYYSAEVKQYQTEVLANIIAYLIYFKYRDKQTFTQGIILGISGGILLWFSYSVIFTLVGIACALIASLLINQAWPRIKILLPTIAIWFVSFIINYLFIITQGTSIGWLVEFWENKDAFMPLPPKSLSDIFWFPMAFFKIISMPLGMKWEFLTFGFKLNIIPFIFFSIGSFYLLLKEKENFIILLLPLLLTLIASGLNKYPFSGRLILFYVPVLIIIIIQGVWFTYEKITRYSVYAASVLPLLIIVPLIYNSIKFIIDPSREHRSSFREAITYINEKKMAGDVIYLHNSLKSLYQYYKHRYIIEIPVIKGNTPIISGSQAKDLVSYKAILKDEFNAFNNADRVWVLFRNNKVKFSKNSVITHTENESDIFQNTVIPLGDLELYKKFTHEQIYLFNPGN